MANKIKWLLVYIVFSFIWIIVTDNLIVFINIPTDIHLIFQNMKGILFVIFTSIFFYYLILKKEAYEKEKEEKNKLHILINCMVDFVNFKDGEGRWTKANEFALKLFNIEHVDYKGKKDSDLAKYSEFFRDALRYCEISDEEAWLKGEVSRCIEEIKMPDGTMKTFDTIKIPIFDDETGSRKELVVMGRDVTDRIAAERKLAESEQRYKSLFEFNPALVYMIDLKGRLTNVNDHFFKYTGYEKDAYLQKSILSLIADHDRSRVHEAYLNVIRENKPWINEEIEMVSKDKLKKMLRCTAVPMIINDETVGVIGYAVDITKEKETEELLLKTEKLSVIGELAASVAHEIRNPLTSLKGFVQILQTSSKENQMYYNIMLDELERINIIASELLVLAKPQQIQFQKRNINELLTNVKSLLESEANLYGAELEVITNEQLPLIDCEPNQLKQLFINIIKNSIEASSNKIIVNVERFDKEHICIRFTDNGCGIDQERLKHLGEPFYSMKEKGTGLGLTVSYRIVEFHKGKIDFKSKVNEGTTVSLFLPIKK
ncbi:PAS domain-containing sensor histidine kinase [uncultured Metabacillus sp.]|uniref:PAS domain-containing sensor histidine kinase n=1 Tax=uncultured Metabacillus sp. TaxID=2860135 RepID=UPI0026184898|nr:PAS domain-containing sensor histidine kinase [uncultured Metabacillus sp.]